MARLLTHSTLALLLATAAAVLPLAGVANAVEEFAPDETDDAVEVERAANPAARVVPEPDPRPLRDRRPPVALRTPPAPARTSRGNPFDSPLGSRLRC